MLSSNPFGPTASSLILLGIAACGAGSDPVRGSGGGTAGDGLGGSAGTGAGGGAGQGIPGGLGTIPVGDDGCAAISEHADNRLQPADIIFAIDNSGSMSEEIAFVRENLNAFSQQIVDSGVDARIIVISAPYGGVAMPPSGDDDDDDDEDNGVCIDAPLGSGECPDDTQAPSYTHVPEEVGSNDALNLFIDTFPEWQTQLRPNATKTFVVVTDDDATDEPNDSAAAFTQSVASLEGNLFTKWMFSGIYCFTQCPDAAEIGSVYMDLVAQTKGVSGDLCLQDFAPVFDALAKSVIGSSQVDCAWDIPTPPSGQVLEPRKVNVQYTPSNGGSAQTLGRTENAAACGPSGGWYYDDNNAPKQVLACPTTCTALQADSNANIDVLFGCDSIGTPE